MAPTAQRAAAVAGCAAVAGTAFVALRATTSERSVAPALRGQSAAAASTASGSSLTNAFGAVAGAAAAAAGLRRLRKDEASTTRTVVRAFENELGVQAPVGFWDPAGFTSDGDAKDFYRRRVVELKHGRVSMLACTGYIVQQFVRFPGDLSPSSGIKFAEVPNGLAAVTKVPAVGWFQYTIFCGLCDLWIAHQVQSNPPGKLTTRLFGEGATNYEYGFLGVPTYLGGKPVEDAELRKKKLNAELANGRLAMMAIIGMFFQDGLTGSAWGDWANYTDSPLRAFENELGAQAPLGFWDPLGLSSDGDMYSFKRRRSVEIKHGRICMLATMGYITPEITGKFPGYISPSTKLLFSDIPNGLGAIAKVPLAGWIQILAYCAYCEIAADYDSDFKKRTPGDMGWNPPLFSIGDAEVKKRRLASEIANGRLAMMAIIGMFFQDGLTGSAWGDWANYTDSPLRAFENELGVQAPLGYFDPLGMSKDGDVDTFRRRREAEIKNGRVAMFATMGYMVPEYFKFPGYLAPSSNLKFADVPNGIQAITKVPPEGWLQWVALCGCYELVVNQPVDAAEPGNYGKGRLGYGNMVYGIEAKPMEDAEGRKRGLNSELANGRLAMMAIMGLWVQDGLFGTPYGLYQGASAFENELGVQAPLGYFDPLGLSADGDVETFRRRRESEIKNGRVAMFATIGYMVPEYFKFPGYLAPSSNLKFADVPNGIQAITKVPAEGWLQWVALCGAYELVVNTPVDAAEPGNYGKGKLGYGNMVYGINAESISDPEARKRGLNSEIANGRLAMMAIMGLWVQDGLFGTPYGLYTGTGAFESELGVQAPLGFWDPLGFTKGGDAASFRRRRYVEIKHGRVAMFACLGYIVPEYYRWPGDLSPSLGLKFTDVPTGFAAFSKVPLSGWAQMIGFAGSVELFQYVDDPKRAPGDFENAGLLGIPNGFMKAPADQKQKKLAAEIANGRLAMMAIIGMFFQNGLTGTAWGDWSLYTDSPLRSSA